MRAAYSLVRFWTVLLAVFRPAISRLIAALRLDSTPNRRSIARVIYFGVARLRSNPKLWVNRLPQSLHLLLDGSLLVAAYTVLVNAG